MMTNDVTDELTRLAIRHALEQYGHYFETIEPTDSDRAEQLGRLGRAVADDLGVEVSMAALDGVTLRYRSASPSSGRGSRRTLRRSSLISDLVPACCEIVA